MLYGEIKVISEHFKKCGDYGDHIAWNRIKKALEELAQQPHNSDYAKCTTEVLNYIRYSIDSKAGRDIRDIIKKHFA